MKFGGWDSCPSNWLGVHLAKFCVKIEQKHVKSASKIYGTGANLRTGKYKQLVLLLHMTTIIFSTTGII